MAKVEFRCDSPRCGTTVHAETNAETSEMSEVKCTNCGSHFIADFRVYRENSPLGELHEHGDGHVHSHEGGAAEHEHEEDTVEHEHEEDTYAAPVSEPAPADHGGGEEESHDG